MLSNVWSLNLSASEKLVLLAMELHADDTGQVRLLVNELAEFVGCDARLIRKVASKLLAAGYLDLTYKGGGRGRPNEYRVTVPCPAAF